jgi:hypothetical protein
MGWSPGKHPQIVEGYVEEGMLHALVDMGFPPLKTVPESLHFVLVQGDRIVHADATFDGTGWRVKAPAPGIQADQPALATATLTRFYENTSKDLPRFTEVRPHVTEVISWSEMGVVDSQA